MEQSRLFPSNVNENQELTIETQMPENVGKPREIKDKSCLYIQGAVILHIVVKVASVEFLLSSSEFVSFLLQLDLV